MKIKLFLSYATDTLHANSQQLSTYSTILKPLPYAIVPPHIICHSGKPLRNYYILLGSAIHNACDQIRWASDGFKQFGVDEPKMYVIYTSMSLVYSNQDNS